MTPFGDRLWLSEGGQVTVGGFAYPTRMAALGHADGSLTIWSPIRLTPELKAQTDAVGPVREILAPNKLHHLFLADWAAAYPDARLLAAPGLAAKRTDLPFSETLTEQPRHWHDQIDMAIFPTRIADELVLFHRASATVLFCDLLQQFPPGWFRSWRRFIAKLDLMTEPEPTVPRKFRFATRRPSAQESLAEIHSWPAIRVVMAHGNPVTRNAQGFLDRAFSWLD